MFVRAQIDFKSTNSKGNKADRLIFTDQSEYDFPIKKVKLFIDIPGFKKYEYTINANQVNIIRADFFKIGVFPDGVYNFFFDVPDCPFELSYMNTYDLDNCITEQISKINFCNIDKKKKDKIDDAILLREQSKLMECDSTEKYQLARDLICKDCK